jgi:hypothetical protein
MPINASDTPKKVYVGKGWTNKYGIAIEIKKDEIAKLEANAYGGVRLYVGLMKEPDSRSKATHFVAVEEKSSWVPPAKAPEGMPQDKPGEENLTTPF